MNLQINQILALDNTLGVDMPLDRYYKLILTDSIF